MMPVLQRWDRCRRVVIALLWGALLAGIAVPVVVFVRAIEPLAALPVSCEVLHDDGMCEVRDDHLLRVRIEAPVDARFTALDGGYVLTIEETRFVDNGWVVSLRVRQGGPRGLWLLSRRGLQFSNAAIRVADQKELPWLKEARRLNETNQESDRPRAIAILREHLNDATPADQQARALHIIGRMQYFNNDIEESIRSFEGSIQRARDAGLLSYVLQGTVWITRSITKVHLRYNAAQSRLTALNRLFERAPGERLWQQLQLALYAWHRGDVSGTLLRIDEGLRSSERLNDPDAIVEFRQLRAEVLQAFGRSGEAMDELDAVPFIKVSLCRQAYSLGVRGGALILVQEAKFPSEGPVAPALDPVAPLEQSLKLFREQCPQKPVILETLLALSHASLLNEQLDRAERYFDEARSSAPDPGADSGLHIQLTEIEARLLLRRGNLSKAAATFQRLSDLAVKADTADGAFETRWHAALGRAEALEQIDPAEAERAYREAEQWLDERARVMPLGGGRAGFLGRHERGTALFVDFLIWRNRRAEALQVIRHARVRALLALSVLSGRARLGDDDWKKIKELQQRYLELRFAHKPGAAIPKLTAADQDLRRGPLPYEPYLRRMIGVLEQSLAVGDHAPESPDAFEPPRRGEALFTCHPGRRNWICLALQGDQIAIAETQEIKQHPDPKKLRRDLEPLAFVLRGATRIRIAPNGVMRQMDFETILGSDEVQVTYALDLPGAGRRAVSATDEHDKEPRALLVIDPDGELIADRPKLLADRLRQLLQPRFDVTVELGQMKVFGHFPRRNRDLRPRLEQHRLRSILMDTSLFLFFGHGWDDAKRRPWGSWLALADHGGLMVGDILMLDRAPRRVVLLACWAGRSDEETGGLEGLGIAQAFLARGSDWVIAAVDVLDPKISAEMAEVLFERGLAQPDTDPASVLREARTEVRKRLAANPHLDRDLTSFHVFER